jgi:very-short-patch-repair endonuclease
MTFLSATNGRLTKLKNPFNYMINWDGKCRSKFQANVKTMLKPYWFADIVFEELPVIGTRMTIDFYNANKKLALEVDGSQHYKYNKHFHGGDRQKFLGQLQRDEKKEHFCEINNIKLVRILQSDKLSEELLEELELI